MSKFSVQFFGFLIISASSILCRWESPKKESQLALSGPCVPTVFTSLYANISGAVIGALSFVAHVFMVRTFSKIFPSIIKTVAISVIALLPLGEQCLVHRDCFAVFVSSLRVPGITILASVPVPLREKFKILSVNDGVLPFGEGNKFIRLVEWLDDLVFLDAKFHANYSTTGGTRPMGLFWR